MLQAEIDTIRQDYKVAITRYYTGHNVDKALKKQMVETINPMYISALRQPLLGLKNAACLQVMQHQYQHYGRVSPTMLQSDMQKYCQVSNV
eukprot:15339013-Ditylum_brightwellii.AAC.1